MFATSFTSIAVIGCELQLAELQHTNTIITYSELELLKAGAAKTGKHELVANIYLGSEDVAGG